MSSDVLDKPIILDELDTADFSGFPEDVFVINCGNGKYAAMNATTNPPDPITKSFLAVFEKENYAQSFITKYKVGIDIALKSLEETRKIALAKECLSGLILYRDVPIVINGVPIMDEHGKPKLKYCTAVLLHWVR